MNGSINNGGEIIRASYTHPKDEAVAFEESRTYYAWKRIHGSVVRPGQRGRRNVGKKGSQAD
jgi:hypothetical protein